MTEPTRAANFSSLVDRHSRHVRSAFAEDITALAPALDPAEIALIVAAGDAALVESTRLKLNRVLLLELHAAKRTDSLHGDDDAARFDAFVQLADRDAFDTHLDRRYPPFRQRLQQTQQQLRGAIATLASRLCADRALLTPLLGQPAGRLCEISVGMGDVHAGGHSVAQLQFEGGRLLYKPRSLRIDVALDGLLQQLFGDDPERIRVPPVLDCGDYGWAAFVTHRYCSDDAEQRRFYFGLGQWLAVLRLLGGVDIHQENLIACGPVPVIIDAESLFAANLQSKPSGNGQAHDLATDIIFTSVQRTGIVPWREATVGFQGVDLSAAGGLPGQQPKISAPVIADEGTTEARLKMVDVDMSTSNNHPSPNPDVSRFWDQLSDGFLAVSSQLRELDARGALEALLQPFLGCTARAIRRSTQTYVEMMRMLWHPASLHDEAAAIERARNLLQRNALEQDSPSLAADISMEIDAMRVGDVPIFVFELDRTRIDAALADWRRMRIDLEELTIRCALVATNLNRGAGENDPGVRKFFARQPHAAQIDERRRRLAREAVQRLLRLAVRGGDGSVTWITPETSTGGWLVQPLACDLYFGLGGVLVALAGYQLEARRGHADAIDGLEQTIDGALRVLAALDAGETSTLTGGYHGFGARIWIWLTLADLLERPSLREHAANAAAALERAGFAGDDYLDIIDGSSGVIVPLLQLAQASGEQRWLDLAAAAGRHLEATAIYSEAGASWQTRVFVEPTGGFAHGAAGVAWALMRLALSPAGNDEDRARWRALAEAGFAFQNSLYCEQRENWLDRRQLDEQTTFHTWCNGSVGIGLAAADLYERTGDAKWLVDLRRAVRASRGQWGISHTLCHGDLSLSDLLLRAARLDPEHCGLEGDDPVAQVVSAIEEHRGYVGSLTRAAFTPGLMTGLAGAVHGLNRLHADCAIPSPLLFEQRARNAA